MDADDLLEVDLAARRDLADRGVVQQRVATASNLALLAPVAPLKTLVTYKIGNQAGAAHLPDRMLGRLGLLLSVDPWMFGKSGEAIRKGIGEEQGYEQRHEGDVDVEERGFRVPAQLVPELHERLDERPRLEITSSS